MTSLVSSTTLDALRLALIIGVMSEVSQNDALLYTDVDFFFLLNIVILEQTESYYFLVVTNKEKD